MSYTLPQTSELLQAPADKILRLVQAGKVHPMIVNGQDYFFSAEDLTTLGQLLGSRNRGIAPNPQIELPNPDAEFFSAKEVGALLNLSPDTVRRLFENEDGVLKLGDPSPRGKRRRVTLRIPRAVVERVKTRLANG